MGRASYFSHLLSGVPPYLYSENFPEFKGRSRLREPVFHVNILCVEKRNPLQNDEGAHLQGRS